FAPVAEIGLRAVEVALDDETCLRVACACEGTHAIAHVTGAMRRIESRADRDIGAIERDAHPWLAVAQADAIELVGKIEHAVVEARDDKIGVRDGAPDLILGADRLACRHYLDLRRT